MLVLMVVLLQHQLT